MDRFHELLDATISHLQSLKRSGTKYLPISPGILGALSVPMSKPQTPAVRAKTSSPFTSRAKAAPSSVPRESPPILIAANQDKAAAIQEVRERALVCQKCPSLASSRKNVVFGVGSIEAELMFVGEAPG